ncbi:MAG TPA: hypothetical protein VMU84_20660 [Thermoanaerobaculia bacterium]|nr:hypothetical protein [Thermoanaerobaculia bacterium]
MLATDDTTTTHPHLETWAGNERMRHVPTLGWITEKLDVDLRRRIELLSAPFETLASDDPRRGALDHELRALCRAIDRLADLGKHARINNGHAPADVVSRLSWAITHAVSNLQSTDANLFGRRYPMQTHERSKAEPLYAALLVVIEHVKKLGPLVRAVDASVDEKLFDAPHF